ncbi:hypothetical protein BX661DRAFT_195896 [Kickxella alabastrina]|uniref:uncharacterized protein n=1 Tax=Kickxella alabastrina TaxID=61397 RepID=UPI00221E629E|nr:uncharacterized protein BX661DRAFT_195896 [Kickxella alabastrina]KAI7834136.1 hypothetical protein BX661DRAFT_195896 [Kickxella alabastrina]
MDARPEPLLKYAEELLQSYSRLIVHSGDILRSLPEPREGLSVANIKPKKDESTAFLREWQHLESVFDEYLIRLNDVRARAHEELEAARIKCLAGEDIDLTLPEAQVRLGVRLEKYKRQYDTLQQIISGVPITEELNESSGEQPFGNMEVDASDIGNAAVEARIEDTTLEAQTSYDIVADTPPTLSLTSHMQSTHQDNSLDVDAQDAVSLIDSNMDDDVNTPMSVQDAYEIAETDGNDDDIDNIDAAYDMDTSASAPTTEAAPIVAGMAADTLDAETIDLDAEFGSDYNEYSQAIELDSGSEVDDEDMEDIFQ